MEGHSVMKLGDPARPTRRRIARQVEMVCPLNRVAYPEVRRQGHPGQSKQRHGMASRESA